MFKLVLEKAEEPEIKLPTSAGSLKKQESSRKISISALLSMPKPLTVWITINCGKFWKRWEYQTIWPASWGTLYAGQEATVRTGHGTTDWFQIGKGVHQGCIPSAWFFNLQAEYIMQNSRLDEAKAVIKNSGINISNLRYGNDTPLVAKSESCSALYNSLWPHGLSWYSPGHNTGVGSCSLLQGILPTQGLNPGLP